MSTRCGDCQALHWNAERTTGKIYLYIYIYLQTVKDILGTAISAKKFTACCNQGKVQLPYLAEPPEYLQYLLSSTDAEAKTFRKNIRQYNSALAFTSVKYNVDDRTYRTLGGIQCFQILTLIVQAAYIHSGRTVKKDCEKYYIAFKPE